MQIQATDRTVTVREYTFTITDVALAVYLDDPAQWAADTRQLLAPPPAAKRAKAKRSARSTPKGKAPRRRKGPAPIQCPKCPRQFKGQGHLDRHLKKAHSQPTPQPKPETPAE